MQSFVVTELPMDAASRFVLENQLPSNFVSTITDFILSNTNQHQQPTTNNDEYIPLQSGNISGIFHKLRSQLSHAMISDVEHCLKSHTPIEPDVFSSFLKHYLNLEMHEIYPGILAS